MPPVSSHGSRPKIIVIDDWDGIAGRSPAIARLREHAEVNILGRSDEGELVAAAQDASVIIPIRERRQISSALLTRLPALRHIAQTGGGIAHIDENAARAAGVTISRTGGASAHSVAELAVAMMVASRRSLFSAQSSLSQGRWERPLGEQLAGSTLGVIGFGATGRLVATFGLALGMRVLVCSRRAVDGQIGDFPAAGLDEVCRTADVLSLHVELSQHTVGMIARPQLRAIGATGLLVNTARAALIVENDLIDALDSGELGAAALDVFHREPPDASDRLVSHPSVVALPHLGWRTNATMEAYLEGAVDNIMSWLNAGNHNERAE